MSFLLNNLESIKTILKIQIKFFLIKNNLSESVIQKKFEEKIKIETNEKMWFQFSKDYQIDLSYS